MLMVGALSMLNQSRTTECWPSYEASEIHYKEAFNYGLAVPKWHFLAFLIYDYTSVDLKKLNSAKA